jgi:hypothetical protein
LERLPGGIFTHWEAPPYHGARHQETFMRSSRTKKETRRSGSENWRVSNHISSVAASAFDSHLFDESRD